MKGGKRVGLALLMLLALTLPELALAQEPPEWVPRVKVDPLEKFARKLLGLATLLSVLYIIGFAFAKILLGRAYASSGAPGIASRGHSEMWEGFTAIVWFAAAVIALPWVVWLVGQAGLLPEWVVDKIGETLQYIWTGQFLRE